MAERICDLIKGSFINDYWTAGYKAEVSFDTLLTPVIEEIIQTKFPTAKYVTKEFPILRKSFNDKVKSGFDSINVDYVLSDKDKVYFVELKTTMDSIDKIQITNYENILKNTFDQYVDDFIRLLNHNSASGIGDDAFQKQYNDLLEEDDLLKLFKTICMIKEIPDETDTENTKDFYRTTAVDYLKNRRNQITKDKKSELSGKNKTLFQAGQILDYCISNSQNTDCLRNKKIQIVYLLPSNPENNKLPKEFRYVNIVEALKELEGTNPYCKFLWDIASEIFN